MNEPVYKFSEHDLLDIFKKAFGYTAPPFLFSMQNKVEAALFGKDSNDSGDFAFTAPAPRREYSINGPAFYANNSNGNEVFLPIWLIKSTGTRLLLQNTVSSLSNQVTIVETPLVNRQGTVKEEISINDWIINVKGIIVSADGGYPDEQVAELNDMYRTREAVGIENARTALVLDENEKVVIKSLRFPEIQGMVGTQAFEMELVSDLPFDLYVS